MSNEEWWRGAVIYEIYPRSYMDSNADGIGDLRGIISKMDYIAALGVDAIWIAPFYTSPMKDGGYDVAHYRDVDPIFGTLDDFTDLLNEAHNRSIRVMIDLVMCHTSRDHNWFKESRHNKDNARHDWYYWADAKSDGTPPNNWLAYFGGSAWHWDTRRQQYYLGSFSPSQPSLNLWNPDVQKALLDMVQFWMDMGVDGFRVDAVQQLLPDRQFRDNPVSDPNNMDRIGTGDFSPFSRQFSEFSQSQKPDVLEFVQKLREMTNKKGEIAMLAECGGDDSMENTIYYAHGDERFHFSYCYRFTYLDITKDNIIDTIKDFESKLNGSWVCWAMGSHDAPRVVSRFPETGYHLHKDQALMVMALSLSLRGSYCIYQGEELGLPQAEVPYKDMQDLFGIEFYPEFKGRDGCRTPMPWVESATHAGFSDGEKTWLPVSETHLQFSADTQDEDEDSILNNYRRFMAWRKENDVLRLGAIDLLDTPDDIIAYTRTHGDETVLCLFSASSEPREWVLPDGYAPTPYHNNLSVDGEKITFDAYGYGFFAKMGG